MRTCPITFDECACNCEEDSCQKIKELILESIKVKEDEVPIKITYKRKRNVECGLEQKTE
jgi:hypothetical protein